MTHKSASEYVSVFYKATHLLLLIGALHILLVYLGNGASVEPTESLEMSDVIVPFLFFWLCSEMDK